MSSTRRRSSVQNATVTRLLSMVLVLIVSSVFHCQTIHADEADNAAKVEFFERQVRPILQHRCMECHSSKAAAENGDLNLETVAGIATGGSRGTLTSESDAAGNLLLLAVGYTDGTLQMPPAGKIPTAELEILTRWVRDGSVLPEYTLAPRAASASIDFADGRRFWSFQPLRSVPVPEMPAGISWGTGPIDAFLLQSMRENGMEPGSQAAKQTLLRRVTFDLTGLPPSPADLDQFLNDDSAEAWERVVDRLLASPQYGERWARFWLDLARYTDFTPDWQNPTDRGWLYRDWVVRAFNRNLPYDQFLRLQLAADLDPQTTPDDFAALGFLGLSPTYWKELKLAPTVIEQIVADEWDERIDAVTRTFLGLTVSCARCHDHKFDPISAEDYYGLAGVFASSQLDERPLLPAAEAARVKAGRQTLRELEARLKGLLEKREPGFEEVQSQIAQLRASIPQIDAPFAHVLRESSLYVLPEGDELTKLDYRDGQARDLPIFRRGNPGNPGAVVPRRFLTVLSPAEPRPLNQGSGRAQLAAAILEDAQGLTARVIVNRIWDQHFGAGLVRTPSDFGAQGDRPTHPELLEYLAWNFVQRGWDMKWLHREILLSAAWRQSSELRETGATKDPDNRLLWRSPRRRLDFEMWRDSALMAGARLDLTQGGPGSSVDDLNNGRRSLYLIIAREELHPVLRMHDFPEASAHSPRREPTSTPLQQLFLLNSAWMEQRATDLADQLEAKGTLEGIREAYRLLFSREPDAAELQLGQEFLTLGPDVVPEFADTAARAAAVKARWQDYCQALMSINEFHFLD